MHKLLSPLLIVLLSAASAIADETPAPASDSVSAVTAPAIAPVTAPADALGDVSDFGDLDLAALLDSQVETASKKSESISKAPAIIEVLTRKQLYDLGARDLYSALTYLPGFELVENFGGNSTLVVRGLMQEQYNIKVLMLINGHPSYEPANSLFAFELIPLEAIDRIEIIRGPGSVLYGNNAYAGVINIFTVSPAQDGTTTSLRAQAGQFTTLEGGAGNAGRSGDLAWGVYTSGTRNRGFPYRIRDEQDSECLQRYNPNRYKECNDGNPINATLPYYNNYQNAFGDVRYAGFRVMAGAYNQDKQKFGLFSDSRTNGSNLSKHLFTAASYTHDWDSFGIVARAGYEYDDKKTNADTIPPLPDNGQLAIATQISRFELSTQVRPAEKLTVDAGVGADLISGRDISFLVNGKTLPLFPDFEQVVNGKLTKRLPGQANFAAYGQAQYRFNDMFAVVGGYRASRFQTDERVAHPSTTLTTYTVEQGKPLLNNSPRGSLVFTPREDTAVKLLYGEAYRLPNLWETNTAFRTLMGTTPGLKPETIRTVELGFDNRTIEWLSFRANAYYSLLDDIIARRPTAGAEEIGLFGSDVYIYDNIIAIRVRGIETALKGIVSESLSLFANATLKRIDMDYFAEAYRMPAKYFADSKAAAITANAGVSYTVVSWLIARPNMQFVGSRGASKSYELVNLVVDSPVTENVTLSFIGNNLLDAEYTYPEYVQRRTQTVPGGPGLALYGRVTAQF